MSFLRRLKQNYKHGLLVQSFLSHLRKIGLNLKPYFVYTEEIRDVALDFPDEYYRLEEINEDNVTRIMDVFADEKRIWPETWRRRLEEEEIGLVLWHKDDVAGFTWAAKRVFPTPGGQPVFDLKDDEVYLHDMVIASRFRGASLASSLRNACYQLLLPKNYILAYSASLFFNHPAIRFKSKIGAKRQEMRCEIILFKKFKYDILLRRYARN